MWDRFAAAAAPTDDCACQTHKMDPPQPHSVKIREDIRHQESCCWKIGSARALRLYLCISFPKMGCVERDGGRPQPSETFQRCYGSVSQCVRLRLS